MITKSVFWALFIDFSLNLVRASHKNCLNITNHEDGIEHAEILGGEAILRKKFQCKFKDEKQA